MKDMQAGDPVETPYGVQARHPKVISLPGEVRCHLTCKGVDPLPCARYHAPTYGQEGRIGGRTGSPT